jgi:hypothetical protein
MKSLAGRLAGSLAGSAAELAVAAPTLEELFADAGFTADLATYWEVPDASSPLITLNGGNVAQLNDRIGTAHAVQDNPANRPAYVATGGPNNAPYINIQDVARKLTADTTGSTGHGAGNRVGYYIVAKAGPDNLTQIVHITDSGPSAGIHSLRRHVDKFFQQMTDNAGVGETLEMTVPALDQAWHLFACRPLATGWLSQIDGATTTPNFTKSETLLSIQRMTIGRYAADSGQGSVAAVIGVVDPTAAKDALVKEYVSARYGLVLA